MSGKHLKMPSKDGQTPCEQPVSLPAEALLQCFPLPGKYLAAVAHSVCFSYDIFVILS